MVESNVSELKMSTCKNSQVNEDNYVVTLLNTAEVCLK